jgi:hypothetical protein
MKTPSLTIFANFWINDDENLLRMKDSFRSFSDICAEKWIVNVRGKHSANVSLFLREELGERLSIHMIESGKGWFHDSKQVAEGLSTEFVLVWVEDHVNVNRIGMYEEILREMAISGSDYLCYSWWFLGHAREIYDGLEKTDHRNTEFLELTRDNAKDLDFFGRRPYLISLSSILTRGLFFEILSARDPKLRRWPKETPFDFEKSASDVHWLPLRMSVPKEELFASIDDDNGIEGYSLHARGLYPERVKRTLPRPRRNSWAKVFLSVLVPASLRRLIRRVAYHL